MRGSNLGLFRAIPYESLSAVSVGRGPLKPTRSENATRFYFRTTKSTKPILPRVGFVFPFVIVILCRHKPHGRLQKIYKLAGKSFVTRENVLKLFTGI